ncbi:MAG: L7Ae/L30e/S12e/Gadd45 family ribosomal protein [Eubacteriales bacterium]
MEKNKFLKFLGLCKKSGKILSGDYSVEKGIYHNKVLLMILSEDCSKEKGKKFTKLGQEFGIDIIQTCTTDELGSAIGKHLSSVIAITDIHQKNKIMTLYVEK